MKDLGFVIVDLAKFYGQWWLWVEIWWCHGGFVGFFWIWVLLLRWWLWLAEVVVMADLRLDNGWVCSGGGCGLRYGGGYAGFFGFGFVFTQFAFSQRERERERERKMSNNQAKEAEDPRGKAKITVVDFPTNPDDKISKL